MHDRRADLDAGGAQEERRRRAGLDPAHAEMGTGWPWYFGSEAMAESMCSAMGLTAGPA